MRSVVRRLPSLSLSLCCALGALLSPPARAAAQPAFSASFEQSSIGPGSATLLRFVLNNGSGTPASGAAFTATLPAGVTFTAPSGVSSTCVDAQLDAPAGGTTLAVTDIRLGGSSSCTVSAYVTSSTPGTHTLVSGDLTSSAGNSGPASADLTIATNGPGVTLSASPASVPWQGRSTLTYTFDNTANPAAVSRVQLSHSLPAGVTVASPSRVFTDCAGSVASAAPGGQTVTLAPTFSFDLLAAGATCTLRVDVRVETVGEVLLVSDSGTATPPTPGVQLVLGRAVGSLAGTTDLALLKVDFVADPVAAGSSVELQYTLYNRDRNGDLTGLAFQHDLGAALSGLAATAVLSNDCGGAVSAGSTVDVSGVSLSAGAECQLTLAVSVPAAAPSGSYVSSSSALSANPAATVVGPAGSDILEVLAGPRVTVTLSPDPIGAGDTLTVEFAIENVSATDALTAIAFTAPLDNLLPGAVWTVPGNGFCGGSAQLQFFGGTTPSLNLNSASLAAAASCTFSATATVPGDTPSGVQSVATSLPTATLGGQPVTGAGGSDSVTILAPPNLSLAVVEGMVVAGQTATLSLTLTNNENGAMTTGLAFDLLPIPGLAGFTYSGLPSAGFCGAGASVSVDGPQTTLTFAGVALDVGASCTFEVTVNVPASAPPATYTVSTTDVSATVGSVTAVGNARTAPLQVGVLRAALDVVDDPALAGDTVTLEFTLENLSSAGDITGLVATVDLSAALPGLVATGLPANNMCGAGSQLVGTNFLILTGGALAAGESCAFSVTLAVPAAAADGQHAIVTSALTMSFDGSPATAPALATQLLIGSPLMLAIALPDGPARAGDTTTLAVTLANASASAASALAFTLDLDAAFPGLIASTLPSGGECGASITGTGVLDVSGGSLEAGDTCAFDVELTLPNAPAPAGGAQLETSPLTGTVNGLSAGAGAARATLVVLGVDVTLPSETNLEAGTSAELLITVTNFTGVMLGDAAFTLPLTSLPTGVTVTDVALGASCMGAVTVSGTATLGVRASGLDAGQVCDITLTLSALGNTTAGDVALMTSPVTNTEGELGAAASGTLHILPAAAPSFGLAVTPSTVTPGQTATVTYIVTNAGSLIALSGLSFTHTLPTGLSVVSGSAPTNDCGGTLDAVGTSVALTDGALAAMTTCTITVEVSASALGEYTLAPSALDSSRGALSAASATLSVVAVIVDAGVPDGAVGPDGAVLVDSGMTPGGGGGGCGCRVGSRERDENALGWAALGLLGAFIVRRRQRR